MKHLHICLMVCLMAAAVSIPAYASASVPEEEQIIQESGQSEREVKKALREEKQAYRDKAQIIRNEIKAVNAEIKEVNLQIQIIRQDFLEIRDAYRNEKILPNGWTKENWKAFLAKKKELMAAVNLQTMQSECSKADDVEGGNDSFVLEDLEETAAKEENSQTELSVQELVAERRFDEALTLLGQKKEARLERLARRQEVLAVWKEISTLLHP